MLFSQRILKLLFTSGLMCTLCVSAYGQLFTNTTQDVYTCVTKNIGIQTSPSGGTAPYTYSWTPATGLSATNISNPTVNTSATRTYRVTITDANSNVVTDSVTIFVGNFPPKIEVFPDADTLCGPDTVRLNIRNDQDCALNGAECLTSPGKAVIGTGTFQTSAATISPYFVTQGAFNATRSNKRQFILQPAEIKALGLTGRSNITSLGFFSTAFTSWTYENFTIRMACSPDSTFTNTAFKTGLQTVFDPKTVVVPTGTAWTEHFFDNAFTWDGSSSIVVEICFTNSFDQGFNGPIVRFSNLVGQGVMIHNTSVNNICGATAGLIVLSTRPHVQVGFCRVTHLTPLTYSWTPAASLSNAGIYNPLATVATSANYILTATDTNGCVVIDTAKIEVAGDFTLSVPNDTNICSPGSFPLSVTDNAGPGATYSWEPSSIITNANSASATANVTASTEFVVEVKSAGGCAKKDTINVGLVPPINLQIITPDSTICAGDSLTFDVSTDQPQCVTINRLCPTPTAVKVGLGTNNLQGAAVSPFGSGGVNHNSQKKQIIIRQSELNTLGIVDPTAFSSIGVTINSLSGQTAYENFTIKMSCTSTNEFNFATNTNFDNPLQTVFTPKTVNITTGFNNFVFDKAFVWDGNSNLIIEFCFENTTPVNIITDFQQLPSSTAGFGAILWKSGTSVCGDLTGGFVSFFRPDLTFGTCEAPPREDLSYQWTPSTGILDDTIAETSASPAVTTTYILSAQAANSVCVEEDTIDISVAANYTTTTTNDTVLCEPGPLPVFVSNTATAPVTVSWEPASLFTSPNTANTIANPTGTTDLIVRLDAAGCVKFDTINAGVLDLLEKTVSAQPSIICRDSTTQLEAFISPACNISNANDCTAPLTAQPAGGPTASSNLDGITPFISSVISSKRQYLYRASELNTAGITSDAKLSSLSLVINTLGVINTYENFTIKIGCANRNSFSNRFITGTSTVFDSKTINISSGLNVFQFDHQYNWDGVSNLVIEICYNNSGFTSPFWQGSNIDYVTTSFRSAIVINAASPVCTSVNGAQVFWRPDFEIGYCLGTSSFTYNWTPTASLNSPAIPNPIASPDSTTNYVITFTEAGSSCEYKDSITVEVSEFEVSAIRDTVVCNSFGLQLDVITDAAPPVSFTWNTDGQLSDSSVQNPVITTPNGGYYAVLVSDSSGCTISDTAYVNLFPEPTIDISDDTTICPSDNLTLFIVGGVSYFWSPPGFLDSPFSSVPVVSGLTESTQFDVEILDQNNCVRYDSVQVDIYPTPIVNLGKDSTYCSDFSKTLDAGSGFLTYKWNTGDTTQSIIATPPGVYAVTAEDDNNCVEQDTIEFGVLPAPLTSIKDLYLVCENDSLRLDASNPGSEYTWSTGETTQEIVIKTSGQYWLEIFNGECTGTDTFNVEILQIPVSTLPDTIAYCENDFPFGVPVTAGSSEFNYLWSNGKRVETVELAEPGTYFVRIQNGVENCSILDTIEVEQFCTPEFFIPNSFTPNGDLLNDEFSIVARNIYNFNFKVFNRWGELVYETRNVNFRWDGNYDGKLLSNDTFIWKMTYDIRKKDGSYETRNKDGQLYLIN